MEEKQSGGRAVGAGGGGVNIDWLYDSRYSRKGERDDSETRYYPTVLLRGVQEEDGDGGDGGGGDAVLGLSDSSAVADPRATFRP